jgi:phospholipid-binding lipoprotein MlaA
MMLHSAPSQAAADTPPAAEPATSGQTNGDPWERTNRAVYRFDQGLDRIAIRPAAMGYQKIVPGPLRNIIRNFLDNIHEPIIIANDILQFRLKRAAGSTVRFVANSTLGIGGMFDVATGAGLPHHDNSFGATLGRYGVHPGPYIYLPIAGPSTVRSLIGTGVDTALDPLYWAKYADKGTITVSRAVVNGLDTRARVDASLTALTSDATDPYATLRSVYLQNLQSVVNGDNGPVGSLPDFDDPGAAPAAKPDAASPAAPPPAAEPAPAATDASAGPATTPTPVPAAPEPAPAEPAPPATTAADAPHTP